MLNAAAVRILRLALPAFLALAVLAGTVHAAAARAEIRPTKPSGLAVTQWTTVSVSISWQSVSNVAGYDVYLNGTRVAKTRATSYSFGNLSCGTQYKLAVDSYNGSGSRSQAASVTAATDACGGTTTLDISPPTAPTGLIQSAASASSVSLAWSASADDVGVAGYDVYVSGSKLATTALTSYAFANLSCGTSYTLAVDAYDAAGNRSQPSSVQSSTSPCPDTSPPMAPALLTQTGSTDTGITLSWTASLDNVGMAGYGLYVNGSRVATTTWTTASFGGLACGTSYTLAVDAYDAAGNRSSQASVIAATRACLVNTSTFVPTADTYASEDTQATVHGAYTYLRLQGAAPHRTDFLRFAPQGLTGVVTKATLRLYATSSSSAGVDVHKLADDTWQESALTWLNSPAYAPAVAGTTAAPQTGTWTSVDVTSLVTGNGNVDFVLTTSDPNSVYVDSREAGATAPQLVVVTSGGISDTQPPSTPTGLSLSAADGNSLSLVWDAASDNVGVTGYDLYLNGAKVGVSAATAYTFAGLACATSYTLAVAAHDAAGNRSQSASLSAATVACAPTTTASCDRYASPGGSDSNSGSLTSPFLTVRKLDISLAPGQTGCLRAGSYGDTGTWHNLTGSGSASGQITITAYPGETPTVVGWVDLEGSYTTLSGLRIDGSNTFYTSQRSGTSCPFPVSQGLHIAGANNVFEHNDFFQSTAGLRGNGIGIGWWGTPDNTIVRYNKIHDVGGCAAYDHLIYLSHGNNVQIYGNWLWNDQHGWGVQIYPGATNARVYSNVVDGAGAGFLISDNGSMTTTGNQVHNNVVINSTGMTTASGFFITGAALTGWAPLIGSDNSFTNNGAFNNPSGIGGQTNVLMANNVTSNPQFVNAAGHDYRVTSTSPVASWGLWDGN